MHHKDTLQSIWNEWCIIMSFGSPLKRKPQPKKVPGGFKEEEVRVKFGQRLQPLPLLVLHLPRRNSAPPPKEEKQPP